MFPSRLLRHLLPAVAVLAVAVLAVPGAHAGAGNDVDALRAGMLGSVTVDPAVATTPTPACPAPAPTTAAGWQQAFDALHDDRWSGGDQGASLRLPDGRLLWVFADSFQGGRAADGSRAAGSRFVHNSLVLADGGCLTGVTGPTGAEVVPNAPDGQFFWPQQAFLDGGRLFLSVFRVRGSVTPNGVEFRTTGTFLATFSNPPGGTPAFTGLLATPSADTPDTTVQWGTAVAQDDGYSYLYGTRHVAAPGVFGKELYVSRVPAGAVTDLRAWQYWDGGSWQPDVATARPVKAAVGGVSTALTIWRAADGSWQGVTKRDEYLGDAVVRLQAPAPTGPWTERVIGRSPSYAVPGELTYTALAHPEIPLDGGELLVSISRNNESWAAVLADADLYKPQFSGTSTG